MTSPNMQEAREGATDLCFALLEHYKIHQEISHELLKNTLLSVIEKSEARGRLAGLEEACKAICPLCDRAVKFSNNYPDTHLVGHELQDCDARKIRSRQRSSK